MPDKQTRVLGINPGARYLGYALINNSELRDWGIKSFKGKWTAEKSQKIGRVLIGFLDQYQPDVVALKKLHPARTSHNLHGLVNSFKYHCRIRNIPVYEYPIGYLKEAILHDNGSKKKLVKELYLHYPALFRETEKELKMTVDAIGGQETDKPEAKVQDIREKELEEQKKKDAAKKIGYYMTMFEAVALGHVCVNQLNNYQNNDKNKNENSGH